MSRIMEMENNCIIFSGKPKVQDVLREDNRFVIATRFCSE